MPNKTRKKASKGRFNILLMRPQGEVMNLAVSPVFLVIGFLFAIAFVIVSISIMNRYFSLYLTNRDLAAAYDETAAELERLQSLYTYQASVADDYSSLMRAMNRADPKNDPGDLDPGGGAAADEGENASGPESPAGNVEPPAPDLPKDLPKTLEEWAGRLPAMPEGSEHSLDAEDLRVSGGRFSFSLVNDDGGRAAQGRLLMLFAVETPNGPVSLLPSPDFDPASAAPDFELGPGYNIRAGKTVDGRVDLPQDGVIRAMMVAAKSRDGHIVMKKLLPVGEWGGTRGFMKFSSVPLRILGFSLALAAFLLIGHKARASQLPLIEAGRDRQHLVFWPNSPQELEVYKIYGRREGPTIMIMGGIQGDEPGGFLSADLYADLALKRGNLIVVPRANFRSIIEAHRGPDGDMNRKFDGDLGQDPDQGRVEILKELMAESDLLLNLHDGSGYYRPTWENDMANPSRYGQCIIADAESYTDSKSGRILPLGDYARQVVARVNEDISDDLYKFRFFNTNTASSDTRHKEQRKSATYYALTQVGIPAFGLETSKQLPNLEMKIHQHNLAVNAFMDIFGVEAEQPRIQLEPPILSYAVISVNDALPIAVADGQTLQIKKGDSIEIVHIGANYDRGLSADVLGLGGFNDIRLPLVVSAPTAVVVQKDHLKFGRINIGLLPDSHAGPSPRLLGEARLRPPRAGTPVKAAETKKDDSAAASPPAPKGGVAAFILEVDGRATELAVGAELVVPVGASLKMVSIKGENLPKNLVMNLRGFVPSGKTGYNNGEDRGSTADTARDMMPAFSRGGRGQVYDINAELGKDIVASAAVKILSPRLESVTLSFGGQTRTLKLGGRLGIPAGTRVTVEKITLADGQPLLKPRFTLGGREFPAELPQALIMPGFAANVAVFEGGILAGKVLWFPK